MNNVFRNEGKMLRTLFSELDEKAQFIDAAVHVKGRLVTLRYLTESGEEVLTEFDFSINSLNAIEDDLEATASNWRATWGDSFKVLEENVRSYNYTMELETFWVKLSRSDKVLRFPYSKSGLAGFRHALKI